MLRLTTEVHRQMLSHGLDGLPEEAWGLLAGRPGTEEVVVSYPTRNVEASARVYTVDPLAHLKADRDAESRGLEILGVCHALTHTDAYPSPTDVAQAPDAGWHYVIVSLKDPAPAVRSYRIVERTVEEEPVLVADR